MLATPKAGYKPALRRHCPDPPGITFHFIFFVSPSVIGKVASPRRPQGGGCCETAIRITIFSQKPVARLRAFAIFRVPLTCPGGGNVAKPLTDNCSLYGWTTHSHSPEGL